MKKNQALLKNDKVKTTFDVCKIIWSHDVMSYHLSMEASES